MKSDKKYNIIITGNHKSPVRVFSLSREWIHFSLILLGIVILGVFSMIGDYFHLVAQTNENKILKLKNETMEKQYDMLSSKLSSLELQLEKVKSFSTKMSAIVDVNKEGREMNLVFDNEPRPGQNLFPDHSRNVASHDPSRSQSHRRLTTQGSQGSALIKWPLFARSPNAVQSASTKFFSELEVRISRVSRESQKIELDLAKLWGNISERRELLSHTPSIYPAFGWESSHFGYRNDPFTGKVTLHKGLDLAGRIGTPIYAPAAGVISYVGYEPGYGKIVSIDHGFGVVTRYAHNSKIFVKIGQTIKRRDKIAAIGSTGRSSGPHLHYEVRVNGMPVDPKNYILE